MTENNASGSSVSAIDAYLNSSAAAAQRFTGTPNADVLSGTTGADVLEGLAGDDTYYVNHSGDVIVELANGGTRYRLHQRQLHGGRQRRERAPDRRRPDGNGQRQYQ